MGPCGLGDIRVTRCCCAQNTPRGLSMTEHQNIDLEAARDIFPVKGKLKMWLILALRDIPTSLAPPFFTAFRTREADAHLQGPGTSSPSALFSCVAVHFFYLLHSCSTPFLLCILCHISIFLHTIHQ